MLVGLATTDHTPTQCPSADTKYLTSTHTNRKQNVDIVLLEMKEEENEGLIIVDWD